MSISIEVVEVSEELQSNGVLATLSVGAMIMFSQGNYYATAIGVPGGNAIEMRPASPGATNVFTISMYELNPAGNTAKISLQVENGEWGWAPNMPGDPGIANSMILVPDPGQFMLIESPDGYITIQNTFAPPGPYFQNINGVLTYGFPEPLIQGLFNIEVVG